MTMLRRWTARAAVLALVAAALVAGGSASNAGAKSKVPGLQFVGQAIVPTGTTYAGTTVGGLSSIAYDAKRGVYYALSDDQVGVRYYTLSLATADGALANGDVQFTNVTALKGADGQPFAPQSVDPEGLTLTKSGRLVITSEGFA